MSSDLDPVWKALSDKTRREILDLLRPGPKLTGEIVQAFPGLSRVGVIKHIDVLRKANLIITKEDGRRRINALNPVPIQQIYQRWVRGFESTWAGILADVKETAER